MSKKKETLTLLLALLMTAGIISGGSWWLLGRVADNTDNLTLGIPNNSQQQSNQSGKTVPQTFAQVQNVPSGLFSYGGSTTWAPIRKKVDVAIQTVWPQFRLRYTDPTSGAPGSGRGIKMLLNNQLAFSQSSRPLKQEEYQQASQRGFTLKEIPVAIDGIAIAVHKDLNVSGITVAQLKDIYTGLTLFSEYL